MNLVYNTILTIDIDIQMCMIQKACIMHAKSKFGLKIRPQTQDNQAIFHVLYGSKTKCLNSLWNMIHKTQCRDEVRILSGRTQKLKVAKRCWKQ